MKQILRELNHAIIYESDNNIKILVYGMAAPRKTGLYSVPSFTSQDYQREPPPSPESSPEEADESERADESSEEADSSESTEVKIAESEDSSNNVKNGSSEETGAIASKELGQGSTNQSDINEQIEQKNAAEETNPPKSSQEQD